MRKAMTVSATVLAVLALALPAKAKFEGTAYVSGPGAGGGTGDGGGGPIIMDGSDGGGYPMLAGLLDPAQSRTGTPDGDLGARYDVRYVIDEPPNQPALIQHLYPFAEGGPVIYTPPGQQFIGSADGTTSGEWSRPDPELITELQDRGLPETSPVAVDGPPATDAVRTPSGGSPSPFLGIAVLLAGLVVAATVFGRRRAAARPVRDPA